MGDVSDIKMGDSRPKRGFWAPGNYVNTCVRCDCTFIGDKRAVHCADCAYRPLSEAGDAG